MTRQDDEQVGDDARHAPAGGQQRLKNGGEQPDASRDHKVEAQDGRQEDEGLGGRKQQRDAGKQCDDARGGVDPAHGLDCLACHAFLVKSKQIRLLVVVLKDAHEVSFPRGVCRHCCFCGVCRSCYNKYRLKAPAYGSGRAKCNPKVPICSRCSPCRVFLFNRCRTLRLCSLLPAF